VTTPRVFVGLDEAGYGPLLGPLTYGYAAFRCERGEGPTWTRLAAAVSADKGAAATRLVVNDSKEVFDRTARGRARLEATALAFLAARQGGLGPVRTGRALVGCAPAGLAPDDEELRHHPWYGALPEALPVHVAAEALEAHQARLGAALAEGGLAVVDAGVRVVPVRALNAAFERHGNKGAAHFALGGAVLSALFERFGGEGLDVTCDRLGGRMRYGAQLAGLFPWADVQALREDPEWSEYAVHIGARHMRIRFVEKGDRRWLAVALGSCLAKYARELVMEAFNAWFQRLDASLAPTAGYVQDGRRWLAESAEARKRAGVWLDVLVRSR